MTIDTQITRDQYREAARRHGAATLEGDSARANDAYDELTNALRSLRREPDRGAFFLLELLSDNEPSVRVWAAVHLLPLREQEAVTALKEVASSGIRLVSLDAEMALSEWKCGRLQVE